jgi:hypothetical protein
MRASVWATVEARGIEGTMPADAGVLHSDVEQKVHYVAVFNNVFLAF